MLILPLLYYNAWEHVYPGGYMGQEFDCNYGEEEFKTVDAGIECIKEVLFGDDIHAKERLLYYLDRYMDPYYKKDVSAEKSII